MKKFRFKLEALLRMRQIEEEKALGELAKVMLRVNEQEDVRKAAFRMLREEMDRFDSEYSEDFDLSLWQMYDRYLDRLNAEASDAAARLEEIRPELEKEMAKVMDARRRRRVVEILKERERKEYDAALRKHERRELEEANRRSNTNVGGFGIRGTYDETGFNWAAGPAAGPERTSDAEKQRKREEQLEDVADRDGTTEPERPVTETDYVEDYFRRMGLGKPPR